MNYIGHRQPDPGRGRRPPRAPAGFTLLEMLTVIIIIGLILGIGTPAVLRMQVIARRNTSLATVHGIDGGCKMYWNDFGFYPPSDIGGQGRFNLVNCLVGPGPGFRITPHGPLYGPYNGCEKMPVVSTGTNLAFSDAFTYSIYYYRWDSRNNAAETYHGEDNVDGPSNIISYAKTDGSSGRILRKDFLLCSRGPDGKWPNETGNYAGRDDITNFLQEN